MRLYCVKLWCEMFKIQKFYVYDGHSDGKILWQQQGPLSWVYIPTKALRGVGYVFWGDIMPPFVDISWIKGLEKIRTSCSNIRPWSLYSIL